MMFEDNPFRILRLKQVVNQTGLSRSSVYRKVAAGTFPRPFKLSQRCIGWHQSAITDWLKNPIFFQVEDRPRS